MTSELHCPQCGHPIGTLSPPTTLRREEHRQSAFMDAAAEQVKRFINDEFDRGSTLRIGTAQAAGMYQRWCAERREPRISPQAFGRAMRSNGVMTHRSSGARFYLIGPLLVDA